MRRATLAWLATLLAAGTAAADEPGFEGFVDVKAAWTFHDPKHWSLMRNRLGLAASGAFNEALRWRVGGWAMYDPVYDGSDFYPHAVRADQRNELQVRETYLDWSAGDFDFRFGRQQIVWGEMVGLFFADVVSARDLREYVLAEFDQIRIPQWAARAEWFKDDVHAEAIWIPKMTYDDIGKPGADFYPFPPRFPGFATVFENEREPGGRGNDAYGLRLGYLVEGWDMSAFYYRSTDAMASFERQIVELDGQPTLLYSPGHTRIRQWGATLAKDFEGKVFKAEAVYTEGRRYDTLNLADADGLVRKNTLDYVLGVDFTLEDDARLNLQFFQRYTADHDPDMIPDRWESGASVYYSTKLMAGRLEPEILLIHSLNRSDWLARPRLGWNFTQDLKLSVGVDVLNGPPTGLFGRYTQNDRLWSELRVSF